MVFADRTGAAAVAVADCTAAAAVADCTEAAVVDDNTGAAAVADCTAAAAAVADSKGAAASTQRVWRKGLRHGWHLQQLQKQSQQAPAEQKKQSTKRAEGEAGMSYGRQARVQQRETTPRARAAREDAAGAVVRQHLQTDKTRASRRWCQAKLGSHKSREEAAVTTLEMYARVLIEYCNWFTPSVFFRASQPPNRKAYAVESFAYRSFTDGPDRVNLPDPMVAACAAGVWCTAFRFFDVS